MSESERHKQMIIDACDRYGIVPREDEWAIDPDSARPVVRLGHWEVSEEDEERGLWEGDAGTLSATVVGGVEHGNEQVKFYFHSDETDDEAGVPVTPYEDVAC